MPGAPCGSRRERHDQQRRPDLPGYRMLERQSWGAHQDWPDGSERKLQGTRGAPGRAVSPPLVSRGMAREVRMPQELEDPGGWGRSPAGGLVQPKLLDPYDQGSPQQLIDAHDHGHHGPDREGHRPDV